LSRIGKSGEKVVYLKDIEEFCDQIARVIAIREEVLENTVDPEMFRDIKLGNNGMLYVLLEARNFFSLQEAEDAELDRLMEEDLYGL